VLGAGAIGGEVVVFNSGSKTYTLAGTADAAGVFGVTVATPPLVFSTATNSIPIVTSGTAYINVSNSNGAIRRGDVLVTAPQRGVAIKALPANENPFAIALEDAASRQGVNQVLAHIDPQRAKELLSEERDRVEAQTAASSTLAGLLGTDPDEQSLDEKGLIRQWFEEYSRGALAAVIAIGSLFFVMYTFRTTIINATLSVGRNPRARNAIMAVSFGNIVFAVVISVVALFIAIAVLVLPV
jgi:hypothetical protein